MLIAVMIQLDLVGIFTQDRKAGQQRLAKGQGSAKCKAPDIRGIILTMIS
jgi:hypothetical protein